MLDLAAYGPLVLGEDAGTQTPVQDQPDAASRPDATGGIRDDFRGHPPPRGVERGENVDARLDQGRNEVEDRSARVEEHPGRRRGLPDGFNDRSQRRDEDGREGRGGDEGAAGESVIVPELHQVHIGSDLGQKLPVTGGHRESSVGRQGQGLPRRPASPSQHGQETLETHPLRAPAQRAGARRPGHQGPRACGQGPGLVRPADPAEVDAEPLEQGRVVDGAVGRVADEKTGPGGQVAFVRLGRQAHEGLSRGPSSEAPVGLQAQTRTDAHEVHRYAVGSTAFEHQPDPFPRVQPGCRPLSVRSRLPARTLRAARPHPRSPRPFFRSFPALGAAVGRSRDRPARVTTRPAASTAAAV